MKKIWLLLLAMMATFSLAACSKAPAEPGADFERELLQIYGDGELLHEPGYAYEAIKGVMAGKEIDGVYYYGASPAAITGKDLSAYQGAFLEAVDGYVSYVSDVEGLFLAAYAAEDGEYESIVLDGKHVYGGVAPGSAVNKGVTAVYLVSTPADFTVEIQKNGTKIGELTMADFMKKTPVGGEKVPTAMFDGSFMYNFGDSTYEGRFLGIGYETMLAKLADLGMDLSGNIVEVEYYGTNGLGNEGKNEEYSLTEGDSKYFGSVDFFCMFDGMTTNKITNDQRLGLTAFINNSGGRWMTYDLAAINFVIE